MVAAALSVANVQGSRAAQTSQALEAGASEAPPSALRLSAPPGFDDLLQPQTTLVDIHVEGRRVGDALATFTPDAITFADPRDVIRLIDGLTDPPAVRRALTGALPTNAASACPPNARRRCREFTPDVAAVIFAFGRLRADIVLGPGQRRRIEVVGPMSETGWGALADAQLFTVNALETGRADVSVSLGGTVGRGPHAVTASALYDAGGDEDADRLRVDELLWRSFAERSVFEAGLLRDDAAAIAALPRFLGARWGPRDDPGVPQDLTSEPPLSVFLDGPARVEILDGGLLLDVQQFDGGLAQLDTSAAPGGARDLVLRITDANGEREETRFFARGLGLPPFGAPEWTVDVGALIEPVVDGESLFLDGQAGAAFGRVRAAYRLRRDLGAVAGAGFADGEGFVDGELIAIRTSFDARLAVRALSTGDIGARVSGGVRSRFGGVSLALTHIERDEADAGGIDAGARLLPGAFTEGSLSASGRLGPGFLSLSASERRDPGVDASRFWRADYNAPLARTGRFSGVTLQGSVTGTTNTATLRLGLRVRLGGGPRLRHAVSAEASAQNGDAARWRGRAEARTTYTNQRSRSERERASGRVRWERDQLRYDLDGRLQRPRFGVDANVTGPFDGAPDVVTRWRTGAAFGARSAIADTTGADAGAVVRLSGDADGAEADVLVDRRRRASLAVGDRVFVPLPAFQDVEITVVGRDVAWVAEAEGVTRLRLWPGSVGAAEQRFARIRTVYGRLFDADGAPLSGADIIDSIGAAQTGPGGWFQADITRADFRAAPSGGPCAPIPLQTESEIVDLGEVICRPEAPRPNAGG